MTRLVPVQKRARAGLQRVAARRAELKAPILGLNSRDSLEDMNPLDAISLVNWIPQQRGLVSRKGFEQATTGYAGQVESIFSYVNGTDSKLITVGGGTIYTDNGAGTLTSLGAGFTNSRFDSVKLGANMVLVNGADAINVYDGAVLSTPAYTGDVATHGANLINGCHKHRNRIYLWDTRDSAFYYGGVNSISGNFDEFRLDQVSDTSGNLIEMKTLSRDAGNGPDDYACFILDTGEILIYQGSNPGDANNWALVGKYIAPPIIAQRCAVEFAGDILLLTTEDIVKVSEVIRFGSESGGFVLNPSKLSGVVQDFVDIFGSNYGFSLTAYPDESLIIANMPESTNTTYRQYVLNTVTGSAAEFSGINHSAFGVHDNQLYSGGSTVLYRTLSGLDDDGVEVELSAVQAFSNFGTAEKKYVTAATLYFDVEGVINPGFGASYDYTIRGVQSNSANIVVGSEWDVAEWDIAEWAGNINVQQKFIINGYGVVFSPQVQLNISGQRATWFKGLYNVKIAPDY